MNQLFLFQRYALPKRGEARDVNTNCKQTSNTAASVLASCLNKPLSNAFVKNRYTFRTFIMVRCLFGATLEHWH